MAGPQWLRQLIWFKNLLIIAVTPLVFLFLLVLFPSREARCAYGVCIMAVYWTTEVMPLAVTAFLPIVIFPYLGVLDSKTLSKNYLKDANFLFVGGLIVAVAVEKWNLHKRIALKVLLLIGTRPRWLLFGFMSTTAFLSMWISNTATTAMMVPIAQAVLSELDKSRKSVDMLKEVKGESEQMVDQDGVDSLKAAPHRSVSNAQSNGVDVEYDEMEDNIVRETPATQEDKAFKLMCKGLTLSICYSANIGGTATLTGTGPNLIAKGILDTLYNYETRVTYSSWMIFAFPCMIICLAIAWCWLQLVFLGWRTLFGCCTKNQSLAAETEQAAKKILKKEYDKLGRISFAELAVLGHFIVLVLLWLTRELQFSNTSYGWGMLFYKGYVTDSTTVMMISVLLFIFPSERTSGNKESAGEKARPVPALLDWASLHEKLPWNVIILLGGGFALADACKESGLSKWLGNEMTVFSSFPSSAMVLIICLIVSFFTEITSNSSTATIFIPILAELAEGMGVNPLFLVLPVTVSTSFAFMLPVATAPNAIVFSYGHLKVIDMVKTGFILNMLCILVVTMAINTWGFAYFDLDTYPDWVNNIKPTSAPLTCKPLYIFINGNMTWNSTILNNTIF